MLDAVIDASVVVGALSAEAVVDRLWELVGEGELYAPDVIDVEVLHALRRMVRLGVLDPDEGALSVVALRDMPFERVPSRSLSPRIWELRENLTAYDAAYVALAEHEGLPLLTRDARIGRAPGHEVSVLAI